jgi:hypothetical protein
MVDRNENSPSVEFPCFIVGMSRGGTTWLSRLLNAHPDCVAIGETTFWGRGYVAPRMGDLQYDQQEFLAAREVLANTRLITLGDGVGALKKLKQEVWDSRIREISYDNQTPFQLFEKAMQVAVSGEGKTRWVEKTPHHINSIGRILKGYPSAKFVIQVRDPYGFMLSYKFQGERKEGSARTYFRRLYHPIACAVLWSRYFRQAKTCAEESPSRVLIVDFRDLKQEPSRVYASVLDFFSLESFPCPVSVDDKNSSFNANVKCELSNEDIFWMNVFGCKAFQAGIYEKKPARFCTLGVMLSVLTLPIWFFWLLGPVRKKIKAPFFRYLWKWGQY